MCVWERDRERTLVVTNKYWRMFKNQQRGPWLELSSSLAFFLLMNSCSEYIDSSYRRDFHEWNEEVIYYNHYSQLTMLGSLWARHCSCCPHEPAHPKLVQFPWKNAENVTKLLLSKAHDFIITWPRSWYLWAWLWTEFSNYGTLELFILKAKQNKKQKEWKNEQTKTGQDWAFSEFPLI